MDERNLTEQLVRYDTSTEEGLHGAIAFVKGWLEAREIEVRTHATGSVPSLEATLGGSQGPHIILHSHIDVVPGNPDQFSPRCDGDRLFGRGAYDMKGALAAMLCALVDVSDTPNTRITFICVPDEESEKIKERSTATLVEQGLRGDFALTGEPTDLQVGVQAKGVLALRLATSGTSCHGATPWLGENAILSAYEAYQQLCKLPFSRVASELFPSPSINISRILGGDAFNKVPDRCVFDVDIRYLPAQNPTEIMHEIQTVPGVEIVTHATCQPAHVATDNPFVKLLCQATHTVTGKAATTIGRDGASDAIAFLNQGIPAVEFGPTGAGHHGPQEWVSIQSLRDYRYGLVEFIKQIRFEESTKTVRNLLS